MKQKPSGRKLSKAEAGRLGGFKSAAKGRDHMKRLAAKGFAATVARHFAGDRKAYLKHLRSLATEHQIDRLAGLSPHSCVEIPVIVDPDEDPWY